MVKYITVSTDDFGKKSISKRKFSSRVQANRHIKKLKRKNKESNPMTSHYYKYKVVRI